MSAIANTRQNNMLDLIRATAAAEVCFGHVRNLVLYDYASGASAGFLAKLLYCLTDFWKDAVIVFFLLSGYLVGGSVIREVRNATWSWQKYLGDRLTRLWVVLLPALVLTVALDTLGMHIVGGPFYSGTEGNWIIRESVESRLSVPIFFCNAAFLQTVKCTTLGSNGSLWSLANEFWYYIWFPAIFCAFRTKRNFTGLVCLIISIATMTMFSGLLEGFVYWIIGVLASVIESRISTRKSILPPLAGGAIFLLFIIVGRGRSFNHTLVAIGFFCLLLGILLTEFKIHNLFISRIATVGSNFSYSLYLIHTPLALLLTATLIGRRQPVNASGILSFIAVCAACYLVAYAVYWVFERNTRNIRRVVRDAPGYLRRESRLTQ